MERYIVVSSDCHAGLQPESYRDYLDPQYREIFDAALPIQIAEIKKAEKQFLVAEENEKWRRGIEEQLTGAWDHEQRLKLMDNDGVAAEVIFPDGITEMNTPPFGAGLSLPTEGIDPALQWAGARAHNRWLTELCQAAPERRAGVAIIPALWDIDEAVKEVRWAKDNGLKSVMLPTLWGKFEPYNHIKYDPLWQVCEDLGIVINFHSGAAPRKDHFGAEKIENNLANLPGAVGIYTSEVCWYAYRPLTFMIWGGVFEKFPKLKTAITEGTSVWVPSFLELLDFRYQSTSFSQKLGDFTSHLSMKPSEYFYRNIKLGASCMPRHEADIRDQIGVDVIMWGSDFPHPEGTWPNTERMMRETFVDLPDIEIRQMLGSNALEFYGLDQSALQTIADRIGPKRQDFISSDAA
ncbi:MAG: amidohydrolase family protein [Pseudomonadales bacterium]